MAYAVHVSDYIDCIAFVNLRSKKSRREDIWCYMLAYGLEDTDVVSCKLLEYLRVCL